MNNNDVISRSALMKYINENHSYAGFPMAAYILTMELLTYAPAVDAVEVRYGHWGNNPWIFGFECDQCGKWLLPESGDAEMNYCPNCGANMMEENKWDF